MTRALKNREDSVPLFETPIRAERIALVDDDPHVRRSISRVLEDLGYAVESFAGGPEALLRLDRAREQFSVLITDFDMPGLTGYELSKLVRARYPDIRVLMVSASCEDSIVPDTIPEDWPAFLGKPFDAEALELKIGELLGRERMTTIGDRALTRSHDVSHNVLGTLAAEGLADDNLWKRYLDAGSAIPLAFCIPAPFYIRNSTLGDARNVLVPNEVEYSRPLPAEAEEKLGAHYVRSCAQAVPAVDDVS